VGKLKFYYTNARFAGKTALLAGPFFTVAEAEHCIDLCQPLFEAEEPRCGPLASYGVMEVNAHAGLGLYNRALRANGINVEVPN
jgi:hypothetical protein